MVASRFGLPSRVPIPHASTLGQVRSGRRARVRTAARAALVLALLAAPAGAQNALRAPPAPTLVFDGVTVIDVEQGKLLPNQRIVITGNRINALGKANVIAIPPGAQVVDARGKYLIPGLWNMHVHTVRSSAPWSVFLVNGVTGIRDAGSDRPLDTLLRWRREILAGERLGPPRQILSGKAIDENAKCEPSADWYNTCVADPAGARHLVDSLVTAGADMLKAHDVGKAVYAAIAAEARRLGRPFGGHTQGDRIDDWGRVAMGMTHMRDAIGALEASDLGARVIDHEWGETSCQVMPARKWDARLGKDTAAFATAIKNVMHAGYTPARLARCRRSARRFRKNGTWFVPTLALAPLNRGVAGDAVMARFDAYRQEFEAGRRPPGNWLRDSTHTPVPGSTGAEPVRDSVLGLAERLDLPILAGTDLSDDAFGLHAELGVMVAEGLSPLHALQSATLNPAKAFHLTDSLGTVTRGKLADLVLLDANPLADITNTTTIRAVVANGRYFDRAALDRVLAEAHTQATTPQVPQPPALVFDGVTVVDVEQGKLLPNQRVVLAGNHIQAVGESRAIAVPQGARVIDARNKYLIPGLWDMTVAVGSNVPEGTHLDSIVPLTYKALLANGVTGILPHSTNEPLALLRRRRQEILAGAQVGPPRQILTGPQLGGGGTGPQYRAIQDPTEAQSVVDSLKAAGVDMINATWVSRPLYFAVAAAARRAGLPITAYAISDLTGVEASDSGLGILPGVVPYWPMTPPCFSDSADVQFCRTVAERFRRNGTWITTATYTQAFHAFKDGTGLDFWRPREHPGDMLGQIMHQSIKQYLDRVANAEALHDSAWADNWLRHTVHPDPHGRLRVMQQVGMPLLAGTYSGGFLWDHWWLFTGFALHAQLAMDVMEGLTPLHALQNATLNPAKFLHATDSLGTVAPGKLADLVLLDANPLEEISNTAAIRAVVANGRYYDRAALNGLLRELRTEAKAEARAVYQQMVKAFDPVDILVDKGWEAAEGP